MGVLCDKLNQCHWLNDQDKMNLSTELDCIENQLKGDEFYPSLENVLNAFTELKHFPRIVIVGTDPYPDAKATGIPFSVSTHADKCPPTLKVLKRCFCLQKGNDDEWIRWMNESRVLLLNTSLTYLPNYRRRSFGIWREFIRRVVEKITEKNTHVVFWLMGAKAKILEQCLKGKAYKVFCTCHPSRACCKGENDCYKMVWRQICVLSNGKNEGLMARKNHGTD